MKLEVYREFSGDYQRVGALSDETGAASFRYDSGYLSSQNAHAISNKLPLSDAPFSAAVTKAFFDGIVPEGSLRGDIARVAKIDRRDYLGVLNQVRNEPIGALLFLTSEAFRSCIWVTKSCRRERCPPSHRSLRVRRLR